MLKINFKEHVLPHGFAVLVFLIVTVFFFNPVFFDNRSISQGDITQFLWGSKELRDYRSATGEEGLWANAMFSGMPAYLVNLDWSDGVLTAMKKVLSIFLPHPIANIFIAFICYYILLLSFKVRPYLAIAGALAFGLSSYMIIGLSAGHNARIGAIAFMPLVMAGIHLAFSGKRVLGFGVTAGGLALHLRENHIQITYYLVIVVAGYGIMQLVQAIHEKKVNEFIKTLGVLSIAACIAAGTFFGPLWAVTEFSQYSTRGKSELATSSTNTMGSGLPKSYAFEYSNGIIEPITMLIPNFYGGSSSNAFVSDQNSKTYQALMQSGDEKLANQLAQYSSSYWGAQPLSAPYYSSAIMVFLFVLGALVADKRYVWWLVPVSVFAVMLSWGDNFQTFNYFMFDYLPGYNKFRSVTFSMIVIFFALPLLGMLGLEKWLQSEMDKKLKLKLLIAFGVTGGICLLLVLFAGMLSYARSFENQLPAWFLSALREDRESMLRGDSIRSLAFIFSIFILLYMGVYKKISITIFYAFLIFMVCVDVVVVDKRYFTAENYQRKASTSNFDPAPVDETILKDKGYYRVFNLGGFYEAHTSYFFNSLGGYSGVRIKRYQELYDSVISRETDRLISSAQSGIDLKKFGVFNMLNAKYLIFGNQADEVIQNPEANGPAWFVREISYVNSANEELQKVATIDTKNVALLDKSKFSVQDIVSDSLSAITLMEHKPSYLKYESQSSQAGLVVFSEIYYPKGWYAAIDGKDVPILRANYVLRALKVPAGKHVIEFRFEPKPYVIGNKITMASSWILLALVLGSLGWSLKKSE